MKLRNDDPKTPLIFYIYYCVVFFGQAIQGSFLNMYLNAAGMPTPMVGLLNGGIQILSFVIFPMWGAAADRASSKNKVLLIGMCATIVALIAFQLAGGNVWLLAIIMVVYSLVHNPMIGIYETITMEFVRKNGWVYGPIRMSGTLGFSAMAAISGFVLNDNKELLFPLLITVNIVATFVGFLLPKAKGTGTAQLREKGAAAQRQQGRADKKRVYALLKIPRVRNVLILYGVYMMCNSFSMTYYGIYMTELGGNYLMVGIANMILGLSEIPFHLGPGARWLKRIGVERSLLVVTAVGVVRWIVVGLTNSPVLLMFTMAFNGIMLVPTIVGIVEMVYEIAPDDLKATATQALRTPFQVGGQMLANFGGSRLIGMFNGMGMSGIKTVYMLLSPLTALVGIGIGSSIFRREKREKAEAAAEAAAPAEEGAGE